MAAAAIAALTDPLTVALGAAKPLPGQASQWQGWTLTDLKSDGEWRRGSLVVPGDGLGDAEIMLSYACDYEGQATQGAAVRTKSQLQRLHATLVHDAPGSLVPPLTLQSEQGVDAFAQGLLRHERLRRCRAAVAFVVDLEGFERIARELLELGEEVVPLSQRLALHEATLDRTPNHDADETAAVIADILQWRRAQDEGLLEARRRVEALSRREGKLSDAWQAALTAPFWAGDQKITSEQNLSVLGDAAQRRAQVCAAAALHASPCEETLLALDDARGHLRSVALAALAVDRLRRRGVSARVKRDRAHVSYAARKTKQAAAERADEAAAEIEVPEDDIPDPTRFSVALALSAVALRAQAQYHSLGAAIATDHGDARRAEELAVEADRAVTYARKRFASEVSDFLDRFNMVRATVLARLLETSAAHAEMRRRASQEVLDDFRGAVESPPASPSRIATDSPSRRASDRRAAAGSII